MSTPGITVSGGGSSAVDTPAMQVASRRLDDLANGLGGLASAAEAWHAHGDADLRIIDGFCLSAWEGLEEALSARGVIGLIHHPLALEPFQEAVKVAEYARVERRLLPLLNGILVPSQEMRNRMLSAGSSVK